MRECSECKWCTLLQDSAGIYIYLCLDVDSAAYMQEVGICGNCDLEPLQEDEEF